MKYEKDSNRTVADPGIFQTRGRGPGAVEFLGSEIVLMTYVFVARVKDKIEIVNTAC